MLRKIASTIYHKFPIFQPAMRYIETKFLFRPTFSGWGLKTTRELPWNDEFDGRVFRQSRKDVKEYFEFSKDTGIDQNNIDTLLWRHWIVAYAARHALRFAKIDVFNFVECGVADGYTAFFALREILDQKDSSSKYNMHLYDSWNAMKGEQLFQNELSRAGRYGNLDINRTKRNLKEFSDMITYHQGFIPESFTSSLTPPDSVVYLHIDLNSAKVTLDTLNFFFPRIVNGGVILLDDYGDKNFSDTKKIIDKFFHDKEGMLLKFPTGQAIYYC